MRTRFWGTPRVAGDPRPHFFAPVFRAGREWDLYAPGGLGERLQTVLSAQMLPPYFPATLARLPATIRYHDLVTAR
jgi:hypothetical protein